MRHQVDIEPGAVVAEDAEEGLLQAARDISYLRIAIVNVVFYGASGARDWVLIDAGLGMGTGRIVSAAEERFGNGVPPRAIIMTHGHFDHVGALEALAEKWGSPIYAHTLELPYLDGRSAYPPPDPSVGGGMMARLSPMYPKQPVNVSRWLAPLPSDGSIPAMPGWRWVPTPGHTPGHVSLWRESDRALIVGDAFVTTNQESAYGALTQKPEVHGPPMYFTQDWGAAAASVRTLARLQPDLVVTGHGRALQGSAMTQALVQLAERFEEIAVPEKGRYVNAPAIADATGTKFVPPKR
ncbi:MAG TPA: MBL fold metallo-hydrolase [Methylomirabilota bacterium]|nr:MBL fold metallo-hydrolase [Methylomirabilota bacterium]